MHALLGREIERVITALIMKKLTASHNNGLLIRFCALDLCIEEICQRYSSPLRRDRHHALDWKQIVPQVIESLATRTRSKRGEAQRSGSQGGEIELGCRLEVRVKEGQDIAAVHRENIHGDSVITFCFHPNLVMGGSASRIHLPIVDLAYQYAVGAFGSGGLGASVTHMICFRYSC